MENVPVREINGMEINDSETIQKILKKISCSQKKSCPFYGFELRNEFKKNLEGDWEGILALRGGRGSRCALSQIAPLVSKRNYCAMENPNWHYCDLNFLENVAKYFGKRKKIWVFVEELRDNGQPRAITLAGWINHIKSQ